MGLSVLPTHWTLPAPLVHSTIRHVRDSGLADKLFFCTAKAHSVSSSSPVWPRATSNPPRGAPTVAIQPPPRYSGLPPLPLFKWRSTRIVQPVSAAIRD